MTLIQPYEPSDSTPDFHAVNTVTLGELIEGKWIDWTDATWHWDSYNDGQYDRVCTKINNHYWDREIGILPPLSWKRELLRKLNEIMPKYKPMYKALDNGANILQTSNNYGRNRNVFSDFPATQLSTANQDYAANATDMNYENIYEGDWMQKASQILAYNDIDMLIIKEIESMFSCFYTASINAL